MAKKRILLYPDPCLKQICDIARNTPQTEKIIHDMDDTFSTAPGCVGIAAPQIGYLARIILIDVTHSKKARKNSSLHNKLFCINPEIIKRSGSIMFREGCLSIPDFTGNVIRSDQISVKYYDEQFTPHTIEAHGFEAVVLQHEIDHLDGKLFLDRVRSFTNDIFRRKKYN